jgi:DNA primase
VDLDTEKRAQINIEEILDPHTDKTVSMLESELDKYKGRRHKYMFQRGFEELTLSKYEIGYDGKAMVIPIRDTSGNLRFLKRRFIETKRFDNAAGISKKDILYGLNYLVKALGKVPELYLTESETDTMACYQMGLPAAAVMGRILFKEQVRELLRAGVERVNLFFDNDDKGQEGIKKAYEALKGTPIRVGVVKYPVHLGIDTNDKDLIVINDANKILQVKGFKGLKVISYEEYVVKCWR